MKKDPSIRNAIDENLSSVHFDVSDMHSVLRSVRGQSAPRRARPKRISFQLMFAATMAALVIAPLSILALRAQRAQTAITTITASGTQTVSTATPDADPLILTPAPAAQAGPLQESAVIAAARACFEANCDTDIFLFDEYTVAVEKAEEGDSSDEHYVVTMESIYDNGCAFRVSVSAQTGEVISFSTPRLATVPTRLDSSSAEIQAWYDKYGAHLFTWPLEIQAEFSRRYEGGMLRAPREEEITTESILKRAPLFADELSKLPGGNSVSVYCSLYSERAFADQKARYQIYCFPGGSIEDGLPEQYLLVTMLAEDGTIESSRLLSTDGL